MCRKPGCVKNHVEHYEEECTDPLTGEKTTTKAARLKCIHHKNERRDQGGVATLPCAPQLVLPLELLERAAKHIGPQCPTLFQSIHMQPYSEPYFSQVASAALSLGSQHVTATDMRHEFCTAWRDFLDSIQVALLGLGSNLAEAAAASLMGNSPSSWDATYDDNRRLRAMDRIISMYPRFRQFVEAEHAKKKRQRPRNPLLGRPMA